MQDTLYVKNRSTLNKMNTNLEGITIEDILRSVQNKIRFRVYESNRFMGAGLESLDLSTRSYNCLKRAGHNTVGDIVNSISCGDDLKVIHNCGTKSIDEIMFQLFIYNYECLSSEMQKKYMTELIELNGMAVR